MRPIRVLAVLALAAGAVALVGVGIAIGLRLGREPRSTSAPPVAARSTVDSGRDVAPELAPRVPDDTSVAAEPEPEPSGAAPAAPAAAEPAPSEWNFDEPWLNGARHVRTPNAVFEERYRDASRAFLEAEAERLGGELVRRKLATLDAREAAGLYHERDFDDPVDVDGDGRIEPGEGGLVIRGRSGDPWVQSRETVLPDGRVVSHLVWIPVEEHPELYELADEWLWLAGQLPD